MKQPNKDSALWFFGLAALACLLVSLPATLKAMELFHGSAGGIAATFVFEIGAVGAELATLAIPQWRKRLLLLTITLLVLTTGGNYALGVDHFGTAQDIGTTYATIRAAGMGWLLAIMSSAIFPALLFVFLTAFTARFRMVRGGYDTPAGALAFWMSSYGQWLNTRMNTAEQLVSTLEHSVNTSEQEAIRTRAEIEQQRADYERRLNGAEQQAWQHEQSLLSSAHVAELSEQAHEQALNTLRRQLSNLQRDLAGRDQQVNELLQELNSRPAPMTVEVIKVARAQLTYEQMAQLFDTSVSTVRRRLGQLEIIEQEA